MNKPKKIGTVKSNVILALGLSIKDNTPIFLGDSNIEHMKTKHPLDFAKYGDKISAIIQTPDYIGINSKDDSIEYVKEYKAEDEYVKVAVRVSKGNTFFARSLYVLNKNRTENYIKKGTLKKL